jgi:hypothetical protein
LWKVRGRGSSGGAKQWPTCLRRKYSDSGFLQLLTCQSLGFPSLIQKAIQGWVSRTSTIPEAALIRKSLEK